MPLPGRPLRVGGEPIATAAHPSLESEWAKGLRPDSSKLDEPARQALAQLWLQDARGEHASIPAFSKISLQLAALGAPPELLARAHEAAIEEIGHAQLCFALAEGYSGSSYSVQPIPEMLQLDLSETTVSLMAEETLYDGCLMEGFYAELASAASQLAEEPAAKAALSQIAREEKSHAAFSWKILEWLLKQDPETVRSIVQNGSSQISSYSRPKAPAISHTDPELLIQHGRLPDSLWHEIWDRHVLNTQEELLLLLENANRKENR